LFLASYFYEDHGFVKEDEGQDNYLDKFIIMYGEKNYIYRDIETMETHRTRD
jgi:hypothetical protein